jgi:NAD(P)H dehydrogenase (quinone)
VHLGRSDVRPDHSCALGLAEQRLERRGQSVGLADAVARDVAWGRRTGELLPPAEGAVITPAALTDLAAAAAVALVQPLDGQVPELTGPDAVGWRDLAGLAGVQFRAVSDDEFIAYAADNFRLPEPVARLLAELYVDLRGPWASTPDGYVGRAARPAAVARPGRGTNQVPR